MTASAWVIGSYRDLPIQFFSINAGAGIITAGSRYLYHSTASLSLLAQLQAAMVSAGVGGASAVLLRNRKVKLSGAGNFSIDWPADSVLRNLFGFTGNLAGASTYTAPNISRLLWSPGRPESPPLAPLGVVGHHTPSNYFAISPYDGSVSVVSHGPGRVSNTFWFKNIAADRYQTASDLGGEWAAFFAQVCALGRSFHLWRNVDESDASTAAATLSTSLGPYVMTPQAKGIDWSFTRSAGGNFGLTDKRYDHSLAVHVVPEYVNA